MSTKLKILKEDDALIYLFKPPGLSVHGGKGDKRTLLDLLEVDHGKVYLVHRLDRDTSGSMIVAKTVSIARTVQKRWSGFQKTYVALVKGSIPRAMTLDAPLFDDEGKQQAARTEVTPIDRAEGVSLVTAEILTGRTHQIRRHLAGAGHPVMMDDKHGDFPANKAWSKQIRDRGAPRPKRTMLHALRLRGPHPIGGSIDLVTPLPPFWIETWRAAGGRVDALDHLI